MSERTDLVLSGKDKFIDTVENKGVKWEFAYPASNRLAQALTVTDKSAPLPKQTTSELHYDPLGRLRIVTLPSGTYNLTPQ